MHVSDILVDLSRVLEQPSGRIGEIAGESMRGGAVEQRRKVGVACRNFMGLDEKRS